MQRYVKIISLNVNGLNNPIKRSKVIAKLKREKSQIIFLQETHLSPSEHDKLKKYGYRQTFYSSFRKFNKRGVSILIHNSLNFDVLKEISDKEGQYILVQGKIDQHLITLVNVYASLAGKTVFFNTIFDLVATESKGTLICGGDFNIVLDRKLDSSNSKRTKTAQSKFLGIH